MGMLPSRKPNEEAPLAGREEVTNAQGPDGSDEASWVRLGSQSLWAGMLPDDALGTLPGLENDAPVNPPRSQEAASLESGSSRLGAADAETLQSGADPLELGVSRAQEPGTAEFRILSGARTSSEIRRRFEWKTDKELAEAYEIGSEELAKAKATGRHPEVAYWTALVDTSVKEAASRPTFGELTEWEEAGGRREKRESIKRLNALAKARQGLLRGKRGSV
jgi:hypothetical protein